MDREPSVEQIGGLGTAVKNIIGQQTNQHDNILFNSPTFKVLHHGENEHQNHEVNNRYVIGDFAGTGEQGAFLNIFTDKNWRDRRDSEVPFNRQHHRASEDAPRLASPNNPEYEGILEESR